MIASSDSASGGLSSASRVSEILLEAGSSASSSSSGGPRAVGLERDVRTFTALYLEHGGSLDAFRRELGRLCAEHGVRHWEQDPAVRRGVEAGLARSALTPPQRARFRNRLWSAALVRRGIVAEGERRWR
ncbi:MAG: hypothetical protein AAF430_06330 [Myxococcota bacterium]